MPSEKLQKILRKFSAATIRAAMAERPEIMQASGWFYDKDGNLVQGDPNAEGPSRLASTLTEIASIPLTDLAGAAAGEALLQIPKVRSAVGSYKAARIIKDSAKGSGAATVNPTPSPLVSAAPDKPFLVSASDYSLTAVPRYPGYTPTAQGKAGTKFVDDVKQAVEWASARGTVLPPSGEIIDLTGNLPKAIGGEAMVYEDPRYPGEVLKVIHDTIDPSALKSSSRVSETPEEALHFAEEFIAERNRRPYNLRSNIAGVMKNEWGSYQPVLRQAKVVPADDFYAVPADNEQKLLHFARSIGDRGEVDGIIKYPGGGHQLNNIMYENDFMPLNGSSMVGYRDFAPRNVGITSDGTYIGFDIYGNGGTLLRNYKTGGPIHIKSGHEGLFTAKADRAGMGVQAYASHVLANKKDYPSSTVKQANLAKSAAKWHEKGGLLDKINLVYGDRGLEVIRKARYLALGGDRYKTKLSDDEEEKFQEWYKHYSEGWNVNRDPDAEEHYYDYRGFWKAQPEYWPLAGWDGHLPDTWKTPGHPTFSVESIYAKEAPGLAGHWEGGKWIAPEKLDQEALKLRQYFMESNFGKDAGISGAGAVGDWQITPIGYKQYVQDTGEEGDLRDSSFNEKVRDHLMNRNYNLNLVKKGFPTDSVRMAKAYAAYNLGEGRLAKILQEQERLGTDIYGSLDWVSALPEETRNYINFIVLKKDVNKHKNQAEFEEGVAQLKQR